MAVRLQTDVSLLLSTVIYTHTVLMATFQVN